MSELPLRILLVEDSPSDARLLMEDLHDAGSASFHITLAQRLSQAIELAGSGEYDVMLLDLSLPDSQGTETVESAHRRVPSLPIVVMTGLDSEGAGIEALRQGAQDYLVKGKTDARSLVRAMQYAIQRRAMESQREHHLGQLNTLLGVSARVMSETTVGGLMQQLATAAREMMNARLVVSGHFRDNDLFEVGAMAMTDGAAPCAAGQSFRIADGGFLSTMRLAGGTVRLSDAEFRAHPNWHLLPPGHPPMRGLLGATLVGRDGKPTGVVMVSDRVTGDFTPEDEALLGELAALTSLALQHIEARDDAQQRAAALRKIEWLLTRHPSGEDKDARVIAASYGDLSRLNQQGELLELVGQDVLKDIACDYLDLLETSTAIYEKDGDCALAFFSSSYCRYLDEASRRRCGGDDNGAALAGGRWCCHESCWTQGSRLAVETGEPVDIECSGGMRLYAVPIRASGEVVGAINFGYGDPPHEPEVLQRIAAEYGVDAQELARFARACETRPPFIIELAKRRLLASARLIGTIVEQKRAERSLQKARNELEVRVRQRTADLQTAVEALQEEVRQRISIEDELRGANRALRMFSECDQAVARATDENSLLVDICHSIVQVGGYRLAWVGMAAADDSCRVQPVAQMGFEDGYLDTAIITFDDTETGRGPTGTAIRTGKVVVGRNFQKDPELAPWREQAARRGYASSIAIPLIFDEGPRGCLTIYAGEADAFDPDEITLLTQLANDLTFGIAALRSRQDRRRLEAEVLRTSEMERQRIGHDLHDSLGQTLTGIAFMCNVLRSQIKEGSDEAVSGAAEIERLVNESVALTRALARGLSPVGLSVDSLATGLYEMAAGAQEMFRVACHFQCPNQVTLRDTVAATHLYRIAQEAVNNAVKHGRANRINISLEETAGRIVMSIADDGVGMPAQRSSDGQGMGLRIMRYRANMIGAQLDILPNTPCGALVRCTL